MSAPPGNIMGDALTAGASALSKRTFNRRNIRRVDYKEQGILAALPVQ